MTTININLLPEELRGASGPTRSSSSGGGGATSIGAGAIVPIAGGLLIAIGIGFLPTAVDWLYLDPRQHQAQEEEDRVTAEINKYQVTLNQLKGIADNKEYLRQQLTTLQNVAGTGTSWGDILNEMRSQTPSNLWFDSLNTDPAKGAILIEGHALDYGSVAYFHRNLDHSDYFYEPVLSATTMEPSAGTGVNVVKFSMAVKVRLNKNKT